MTRDSVSRGTFNVQRGTRPLLGIKKEQTIGSSRTFHVKRPHSAQAIHRDLHSLLSCNDTACQQELPPDIHSGCGSATVWIYYIKQCLIRITPSTYGTPERLTSLSKLAR